MFRAILPGVLLASLCASVHGAAVTPPSGIIVSSRTAGVITEAALYDELARLDIVYAGEKHDEALHHHIQAAVLRGIHSRQPGVVVGLEMLDITQQDSLDAYLDGSMPEEDFVKFWKKAWGFDFSMYRPILHYAKTHGIKVRALNAPRAVIRQVAAGGLGSLTPQQRRQIPAVINPIRDPRYLAFVKKAFAGHGPLPPGQMEKMMEAQAVWNETMAENALAAAQETDGPVLVIAGTGHMIFNAGIPESVRNRVPASGRVVLPYPQDGEQKPLRELLDELRRPGSQDRGNADFFWLLPVP